MLDSMIMRPLDTDDGAFDSAQGLPDNDRVEQLEVAIEALATFDIADRSVVWR